MHNYLTDGDKKETLQRRTAVLSSVKDTIMRSAEKCLHTLPFTFSICIHISTFILLSAMDNVFYLFLSGSYS